MNETWFFSRGYFHLFRVPILFEMGWHICRQREIPTWMMNNFSSRIEIRDIRWSSQWNSDHFWTQIQRHNGTSNLTSWRFSFDSLETVAMQLLFYFFSHVSGIVNLNCKFSTLRRFSGNAKLWRDVINQRNVKSWQCVMPKATILLKFYSFSFG